MVDKYGYNRIDEGDPLPPEGEVVDVVVQNGNYCHTMKKCVLLGGVWCYGAKPLGHGVDVYGWRAGGEGEGK